MGSTIDGVQTCINKLEDATKKIINAYCIDYSTNLKNNHTYSITNMKNSNNLTENNANLIRNIVLNAYPFITLEQLKNQSKITTLTEEEAIAGTQAAIWHYSNQKEFNLSNNIKELYNYYLSLGISNIPSTSVSKLDLITNTYLEEGIRKTLITINNTNIYNLEYKLDQTIKEKYNIKVETNTNNLLLTNIPENIEIPINITAKQDLAKDVYFFMPKNGYKSSQSLVGVTTGPINISTNTTIKTPSKNHQIIINKKNSITNQSIENVKFKISNTSDFTKYVYETTTNNNGIATLKNLPNGIWYIKEITQAPGYLPNDQITKIELQNQDITIDMYNTPYGKIKITKENNLKEKLSNVIFNLYKEEVTSNNLIKQNIITNNQGEALIEELEAGTYYLIETKTNQEYKLNKEPIEIQVDYGKTTNVKVINYPQDLGTLIIKKIDSETNKYVSGAIIGIYQDNTCHNLYKKIKTTNQEQIINNIPTGTYCIKEISSPTGYLLNLDTYFLEISKDKTTTLDIYNTKVYNTGLKSYSLFTTGIIAFLITTISFLGYNRWQKRK